MSSGSARTSSSSSASGSRCERRASLPERLFSDAEREYAFRHRDPAPRLAARFGAKEAVMKALGVGLWKFALRDVEVVRLPSGAARDRAATGRRPSWPRSAASTAWLLTLTHTDIMAMAVAVALG